jgi:hypothetical protein
VTESFLHYIWQFHYFKKGGLQTSDGELLEIFHSGIRNSNAGPDFEEARIKIGTLEWRGSVEIHIKASGWNDHHHNIDKAYEMVVLHVVWENDSQITRDDGTIIPTLELKDRVDASLWDRYKKLYTSVESLPCATSWDKVPDITKLSMTDKAAVQRLEVKAEIVKDFLTANQNDWQETCYQLLCKSFGFKVNAEPMLQLAQSLPFKFILKHLDRPIQVEALLFGQAGFLERPLNDDYIIILNREYDLLRRKYSLDGKQMNLVQWRFLRLRPANFPTVRIAQLVSLLTTKKNLFSEILACETYQELVNLFNIEQSEYWLRHYRFGKESKTQVPAFGSASVQNVLINTIAPMVMAYGQMHDAQEYINRTIDILQHIPGEKNKITRIWNDLGFKVKSAFESQGLIELHNSYCLKHRCLECNVGSAIVKSA